MQESEEVCLISKEDRPQLILEKFIEETEFETVSLHSRSISKKFLEESKEKAGPF